MSGVRAAQGLALDRNGAQGSADIETMQDVLYDILATGVDPERSEVSAAHIERFLFEHARAPKSAVEFGSFFAEHGLTVRAIEPAAGVESFALPPLQQVPPPPAALSLPQDDEDGELTGRHTLHSEAGIAAAPRRPLNMAVGFGLGLLCVGLGAVVWMGYGVLQDLRGDLDRAEQRADSQERVIGELEGRAVGIQSSIEANGQIINRMEQKSDLLIDSLVAKPEPPKKKTRWQRR